MCVCVCVCVVAGVRVDVCALEGEGVSNLHVKTFLKALVCMIIWITYNVMYVINVMFYFVVISDATSEFFSGDNKDLLN